MDTTEKNSTFDSPKAQAFADQFLSALNAGAVCLMASIGHRTGLFDAMMWGEEKTREYLQNAGFRSI